jgi:transposase
MITPLVSDELWAIVAPLLPAEPPKPKGGRPRIPDRACLAGIIFVLKTGIQWELLPQELGCGSGMTCWRRLRDWQVAGVWQALHRQGLNWLGEERAIDWSRASIDASASGQKGGRGDGAEPSGPG